MKITLSCVENKISEIRIIEKRDQETGIRKSYNRFS